MSIGPMRSFLHFGACAEESLTEFGQTAKLYNSEQGQPLSRPPEVTNFFTKF